MPITPDNLPDDLTALKRIIAAMALDAATAQAILDEFGLIVVGWSAEWDIALRDAIARCPSRRFTTWWAARGGHLTDRARDLIAKRQAQVVNIVDADGFFFDVEQKVLAIAEVDQPHPLSAKVVVAELKRYLPDPMQQIDRVKKLQFLERGLPPCGMTPRFFSYSPLTAATPQQPRLTWVSEAPRPQHDPPQDPQRLTRPLTVAAPAALLGNIPGTSEGPGMLPLYAARIEDLGPGDFVKVGFST